MKKFLCNLGLIFIVIITTYLGIFSIKLGALFLISSVTAILFANLSKLKSLKLWGLQAELKDIIEEAYATIDQLRSLAKSISKPTIGLLAINGVSAIPLPLEYKLHLLGEINKILKKLNFSQDEINETNELFDKIMQFHHGIKITAGIKNVSEEEIKNLHIQKQPNGMIKIASPIDYKKFLKQHNEENPERAELIKDLEHFIEHKWFRRPNLWLY